MTNSSMPLKSGFPSPFAISPMCHPESIPSASLSADVATPIPRIAEVPWLPTDISQRQNFDGSPRSVCIVLAVKARQRIRWPRNGHGQSVLTEARRRKGSIVIEQQRIPDKQWSRIIARAWADDAFRDRLLAEPKAILLDRASTRPARSV